MTDHGPTDMVIAMLPVDTSHLPDIDIALPKPSIEHTLMQCPTCGHDCWIGPAQLLRHRLMGTPAACYYCLIATMNANTRVVALDRTADEKPRRTT